MRIGKLNKVIKKVTVKSAFVSWQSSNRLRGLSPRTVDNYEQVINYLDEIIDIDDGLEIIDDSLPNTLISHLKATTKMGNNSINNVLRSLNVFLKYCHEEYRHPSIRIKFLKVKTDVKPIFTEEQLKILLRKPNLNDCTWMELRGWTWCVLLFNTGIRCSSLHGIRMCDVNLEQRILTINTTKNKKAYSLKISKSLYEALKLYLKYRPEVKTDYLWINEYGEALSQRSYSSIMARYIRSRIPDIPSEYTQFHIWRRSFATYSLKYQNFDIHTLQVLLGHSHISTTSLYTKNYSTLDVEDFDMMDNIRRKKIV